VPGTSAQQTTSKPPASNQSQQNSSQPGLTEKEQQNVQHENETGTSKDRICHPESERSFGDVAGVWSTQIGWDVVTYVIKEFWPDLRKKHHA
jgi:hypothetical protein